MAKKKSRVPAPPRPRSKTTDTVTAPSRRPVQAPRVRAKDRRSRPSWTLIALAASGIVGLVVAIIALVVVTGGGGGSSQNVAALMRAAGCTMQAKAPPPFPGDHSKVPRLDTPTKGLWNTFPPAAGAHHGEAAVWNFYREPLNPRQVVHNEEHGGVVIWWGPDTPEATVDRLEDLYREEPASVIGTPIAGLGNKVGITAWTIDNPRNYSPTGQGGNTGVGHVAVCGTFDDATLTAFRAFRNAYRGKGPEGVPAHVNQPNT